MLPREERNTIIREQPNADLRGEIEHQMSVDREYPYDECCALLDALDCAETFARNDDPQTRINAKRIAKEARKVLIKLGFYREVTKEEIDGTLWHKGPLWSFTLDGKRYTSELTDEDWFNEID